jgi:hypothetical protein
LAEKYIKQEEEREQQATSKPKTNETSSGRANDEKDFEDPFKLGNLNLDTTKKEKKKKECCA